MKALFTTATLAGTGGLAAIIGCNFIGWSNGIALFLLGVFLLFVAAAAGIAGLVVRANQNKRQPAPQPYQQATYPPHH